MDRELHRKGKCTGKRLHKREKETYAEREEGVYGEAKYTEAYGDLYKDVHRDVYRDLYRGVYRYVYRDVYRDVHRYVHGHEGIQKKIYAWKRFTGREKNYNYK